MLSEELEDTLRRALAIAGDHAHEFATLEHLLLAMTEDPDALSVLTGCKVDVEQLREMSTLRVKSSQMSKIYCKSPQNCA